MVLSPFQISFPPLQAHMENMNVVGQGLDERGRRPWEGSSRTDIRSGGLAAGQLADGVVVPT